VRAGEAVALVARPVRVERFEVLARRSVTQQGVPCLDLDVVVACSSGTYVRALARDLGAALGSAGHLTALRRTRVGPFTLDEALPLPEPAERGQQQPAVPLLGMADVVARCFATRTLTGEQEAAVRVGRALPGLELPPGLVALLSPAGEFLALYRDRDGRAVAEAVFTG
jgi:tRNA pseudouridine55 synthase